ncbi:sulfotransferase domain-containing protein [Ekhidna sp.]|uniref:sulfotransferase domain-containing protein n=1 Tax=Ekhidna sp. TaxID=2608089 RepID=UPI003BAAFA59
MAQTNDRNQWQLIHSGNIISQKLFTNKFVFEILNALKSYCLYLIRKIRLWIVLKVKGKHYPQKSNTIAIFSLPRSGSTWLSELICEIPNTIKVDEPLYRGFLALDGKMPATGHGKIKQLDKLEFYYYQPIPPNEEFEEAHDFFRNLFSLKITNPYLFEETDLRSIPTSKNVLFKFCYGNLLLPWLVKRFDFLPIVLVRNPYAVVASQMRHHSFERILNQKSFEIPKFRYSEYLTEVIDLDQIKHPEEILAAIWCINYLAVSGKSSKKNWLIISYEDLVRNPDVEIKRIFSYVNNPIPSTIWDRFHQPSVSTDKSDFQNKEQLLSWKKELNPDQIKRIGRILTKFKIDDYSDLSITT